MSTLQSAKINASSGSPSGQPVDGTAVVITNLNGEYVAYVGDNSVTSASGFPVRPGQTVTIPLDGPQTIYAKADVPVGVYVDLRVIFNA